MGWQLPWYSSYGNDFNYDFHVSLDENVAPVEYNYLGKAELQRTTPYIQSGRDAPGVSVFLRDGDRVLHTYSAYARGLERPCRYSTAAARERQGRDWHGHRPGATGERPSRSQPGRDERRDGSDAVTTHLTIGVAPKITRSLPSIASRRSPEDVQRIAGCQAGSRHYWGSAAFSWNGSTRSTVPVHDHRTQENEPLMQIRLAAYKNRADDLRITRALLPRSARAGCTDGTSNRTDRTHNAGIIR